MWSQACRGEETGGPAEGLKVLSHARKVRKGKAGNDIEGVENPLWSLRKEADFTQSANP